MALMALFEWLGASIIEVEHKLFGPGETTGGWLFEKTILFIFVLMVVLLIGALEHRTLAEYGFPLQEMFRKNFWAGALWGLWYSHRQHLSDDSDVCLFIW